MNTARPLHKSIYRAKANPKNPTAPIIQAAITPVGAARALLELVVAGFVADAEVEVEVEVVFTVAAGDDEKVSRHHFHCFSCLDVRHGKG
jgi:hypothetical protein